MQERQVQSLGQEDPLEEEMTATVHGVTESDTTEVTSQQQQLVALR